MSNEVEGLFHQGQDDSINSRIARVEAVTLNMLNEIRNMSSVLSGMNDTISNLYKEFMPRKETETLLSIQNKRIEGLEVDIDRKSGEIKQLHEKLSETEKVIARRPTWLVSASFLILGSLLAAVLTYALSIHA